MQNKTSVLKQYFGYSEFREGQEPLIDALLRGGDALGIMPTGAGKSICYQLPALMLPGVAVVVSPLISLMKDQVGALCQSGVSAACVNTSQTGRENSEVLRRASEGRYKILYVAPERLSTGGFLQFARSTPLSLVCVDEAHCVSQWGQDFRPSYLAIPAFLAELSRRPPIGAFTATATQRVRRDIVELIGLRDPKLVSTGFDRKNLYFEVVRAPDKSDRLAAFLKERGDKSGIVYCLSRKKVEEVHRFLERLGYPAGRYHAGLSQEERRRNQERFQEDEIRIMVATNAFGMGIDKSNVSFVIHYNMPKNLEAYYQEAGRAGRDGSAAECLLFYSPRDVRDNEFLIRQSGNDSQSPGELERFLEAERERLRQMTFYSTTNDCLRGFLLRYFGDEAPVTCSNCSNCLHNMEQADVTVEAQKILSCVKRMGERYGELLLVRTLRGSREAKVLQLGFDRLSTYGIMADVGERRVRTIIRHLIQEEYIAVNSGDYPTLRLGPRASEVLFQSKTLTMKLPKDKKPETQAAEPHSRPVDAQIYAKLAALRLQLAREQSVPAYVIFHDATLQEMCRKLPETGEELLRVSGVGRAKLDRYGDAF